MTDIVKLLREAIDDEEKASHLSITIMHFTNEFGRALLAEIERLQAEVAEWKERYETERRDHEAT
jgi:hypothetical protein